jgi:tRNA-specific 2-thiouridylase
VLYVLGQRELARTLLPVGEMTKDDVRAEAEVLGLRTAGKPDSQDVCFITSTTGRRGFLGRRLELRPGRIVDPGGDDVGSVDAVELVTVGQRRGLGLPGGGTPRYVVDVDVPRATVRVGPERALLCDGVELEQLVWADGPQPGGTPVEAQCSAHGTPRPGIIAAGGPASLAVRFLEPQRRVAAGQSVVLYAGDEVVGGGTVAR